ncbi:hypothetical protein ACVWW3_008040 [Bradyrhizobium sp. LM2.9]
MWRSTAPRSKANAGINKAMSYGRMKEAEPRLAAEVQRWLAEAAQTDKAEDRQFGASKRGDEMPDWMANKEKRLEKIRAAKAALEAEAKAKVASKPDDDGSGDGGKARPGRKSKPVTAEPSDKAQRNFTDPDSRVMPTKNGFIQGYNAQAARRWRPSDHRSAHADQLAERSGAVRTLARCHQSQSRDEPG